MDIETAIVFGVGPGLGWSLAKRFMTENMQVDAVARDKAKLNSLIKSEGTHGVRPYAADLSTYESTLTPTSVAVSLSPISMGGTVNLSLPKVTFTSAAFSLSSVLQSMGMTDAFDPGSANFSALCDNPLYISDVVQKASIAMQETGVEASAATAVVFGDAAVSISPLPVMLVNRPFLLTIRDEATGAILFIGHITDPTDTGSP